MPMPLLLLAATAAPLQLKPNGPWVVQVEDSMCLLERNYPTGKGKERQLLIFQPLLDLPTMDFYVMTDRGSSGQQYDGMFKVRIEPGARSYTGRYYSVASGKDRNRITRFTLDRAVLDELNDGDTMMVQAKPVNTSFAIVRPEKARPALTGCIADLKKAWGIAPEGSTDIATPLEGNPARYFSSDSYPPEAYHQGIYGKVIALLNVNTQGRVEKCRIVSSAGQALNDGTCKVAMGIRFKPARDLAGAALASTYVLPVRWVLPGAPQ